MSSGSDRRAALVASLVVLTGLVYAAWPALQVGTVLYFRDHSALFRVLIARVLDAYASGHAALWTSVMGGGEPLAAYPASMAYSPLLPIFALPGDYHELYDVFVVAHYLVAAAGAYLLARALGFGRSARFAAALTFSLSGAVASLNSLLPALSSAAWGPFALAAAIWVVDSPRPGRIVALAFSLALHSYGVDPAFLLADLVLFLTACGPRLLDKDRGRVIGGLVGGAALGLGLASLAVLPALELLSGSLRGQGFAYETLSQYSVHPLRLLEIFLPGVNGDYYDGATFFTDGQLDLYLPSLYVGASVLPLWIYGLISGQGRRFTLAALVLLLLALGHHTFLHRLAVELIPGLSSSRYPVKYMIGFQIAVSIAVASTFDGFDREKRSPRGKLGPTLLVVLAVMGGSAVLLIFFPTVLEPMMVGGHRAETAQPFFAGALSQAFLASAAVLGALALWEREITKGWATGLLVLGVLGLDLALMARPEFSVEDRALYDAPEARRLVAEAGDQAPVVFLYEPVKVPASGRLRDTTWFSSQRLVAGAGGLHGVRYVLDPDLNSTRGEDWRATAQAFARAGEPERLRLLSRLGVTHVLVDGGEPEVPGLRFRGRAEVHAGQPISVYALSPARPEISFVGKVASARTREELFGEMLSRPLDQAVVLREEAPDLELPSEPSATATITRALVSDPLVRLRVTASKPGLIVVTARHGDGWEARVNGVLASPLQTEGLLLGALVPEGASEVELRYRPRSFIAGLWGSGLSLLAVLFLLGLETRRRAKARLS